MDRQCGTTVASVISEPEPRLSSLSLLESTGPQWPRPEWNETEASYPQVCLPLLIEKQVEATPEATAILFEGRQLTYRELNERANQVAHHLRSLGIGPESLVGLCVDRSPDMVVAALGILKAGGAYVPLDPAYPADRLALVIEDAGLPVIVTERAALRALPHSGAELLLLDEHVDWSRRDTRANLSATARPDNLIYVIYTSGSTGKPKGVQITHRAFVNFLVAMQQEPGLTARDTLVAVTTLAFDIAGLELWLPLMVGARIAIASREVASDGRELAALLSRTDATLLQATPVTWRLLLGEGWIPPSGFKMLCGGEALPPELAQELLAENSGELWNMYGPTETTVWSSALRLERGRGPIPVGGPIANTQFYVLDEERRPVPIGEPGELHIGGDGLARGYQNRLDLTAEKFVADPFSAVPGARIYRTGDLVRYLPDGKLDFMGRIDHQVKIRGFRIELGEIESVLAQHACVRESVVIAREDTPGDKRLVAYISLRPGSESPSQQVWRELLRERLPEYMIPTGVVTLPALPLTPNGKIDRKALPAPSGLHEPSPAMDEAPRDELETRLAELWQSVLKLQQIPSRTSFFDLGGNSLLALQLILKVEKVFGRRIAMSAMLDHPCLKQMADLLRQEPVPEKSCLVPLQPNGSQTPAYWLPGGGGISVLAFREISLLLGDDQPIYGLEARHGEEPTSQSLSERAAEYVEEIRRFQPEGPYHLLGFSLGSWVAFEMANQLARQGQQVGLVTVFDTECWQGMRRTPVTELRIKAQRAAYHVGRLRQATPEQRMAYVRSRMQYLAYSLRENTVQASWELGRKLCSRVIKRMPKVFRNLDKSNREAIRSYAGGYQPAVYPGRITVILAENTSMSGVSPDLDPRLGWRGLAGEGIEVHSVPTHHLAMLEQPHSEALAEILRDCLQRAQSRP